MDFVPFSCKILFRCMFFNFSVSLNVRKRTYEIPFFWQNAKFRTFFTISKKPLDDDHPCSCFTRRPQNWSSTLKAALRGDHKNGRRQATG